KLPACAESCPTTALIFGDLNDPNSKINQVLQSEVVYRDKVHLGTQSKLYKVPHQKGEI
ncbi:4Fe-4S ferredoxin, partial [Vibrio sp. D173a]|nr:4Fe-4S ferredoxin [Vibrio sp. D173a]